MELPNNIHVLEGTHSFKIKLANEMPDNGKIIDYSAKVFTDDYLRSGWLHALHNDDSKGGNFKVLDQTHAGPGLLQTRVIEYLRSLGVSINAAEMFTADHYTLYKNRSGSSTNGPTRPISAFDPAGAKQFEIKRRLDPAEGIDFIVPKEQLEQAKAEPSKHLFIYQLAALRQIHEQSLAIERPNMFSIRSEDFVQFEEDFYEVFDLPAHRVPSR